MALADAERALHEAREIGQAAELIYTVNHASFPLIFCGNYVAADELLENVVTLAEEKRADYLKALAMMFQGCLYGVTGKIPESIRVIVSGIAAVRATGSTCGCLCFCHPSPWLMQKSASSMMLSVALTKL